MELKTLQKKELDLQKDLQFVNNEIKLNEIESELEIIKDQIENILILRSMN